MIYSSIRRAEFVFIQLIIHLTMGFAHPLWLIFFRFDFDSQGCFQHQLDFTHYHFLSLLENINFTIKHQKALIIFIVLTGFCCTVLAINY